jgi:penicillin-binding protein 1A
MKCAELMRDNVLSMTIQGITSVAICLAFRWPYLFFANFLLWFGILDLKRDLIFCVSSIAPECSDIPDIFVDVLVIAEDHRNWAHFGVDPVAIIRSFVSVIFGMRQGGSTIEQQFVRVTLARYEPTISRKFREQILATLLSRRSDRRLVAKAYLAKAYYGTDVVGIHAVERNAGKKSYAMCLREVVEVVARLKYPQPRAESMDWDRKFRRRCAWIETRCRCNKGVIKAE